jgi:hypothetical protein
MKSGGLVLKRRWTFGLFYITVLCGLTLLSNHFWLEFLSQFFLPLALFPGRSNRNGREWWTWDAPCHVCRRQVTYELGIISANFGLCQGHFPVCRSAWCASCFTTYPLDQFEVKMPRDFNGATLAEVKDEICFKQARPGDHLCTPFQCPNCQSYNIRGKAIHLNLVEDLVFECMVVRPRSIPSGLELLRPSEIMYGRSETWLGMGICLGFLLCQFSGRLSITTLGWMRQLWF